MLGQLKSLILQFRIWDLVDISIVAYVLYRLIGFIKETRALQLVKGLAVLIIATGVSEWLGLYTINWILRNTMTVGVIALLIIFQPEMRRALEHLGRGRFFAKPFSLLGEEDVSRLVGEIIRTLQVLSRNKFGALIVFEREIGLNEFIETGIHIDALVSAELLINTFIPNTPLHDGAVIIRGNRIVAAGCLLPLTTNQDLDKELGTRHRAAIGVTEQSDAVALVASEETGILSMAENGNLVRHLDEKALRELLTNMYQPKVTHGKPFWNWRW